MKFEDLELAKRARRLGAVLPVEAAEFGGVVRPTARISDLAWIGPGRFEDGYRLHDEVAKWAFAANLEWKFELFPYEENGAVSPFFGSEGALQYTVYGIGGHYDWHVDWGHAGEYRFRKISISVNLSPLDEYDGGELEFHFRGAGEAAREEFGAVFVFPSFVPHRVRPVTRGVRRSLVAWLCGPPLQ